MTLSSWSTVKQQLILLRKNVNNNSVSQSVSQDWCEKHLKSQENDENALKLHFKQAILILSRNFHFGGTIDILNKHDEAYLRPQAKTCKQRQLILLGKNVNNTVLYATFSIDTFINLIFDLLDEIIRVCREI